jgi:hypothetical protein
MARKTSTTEKLLRKSMNEIEKTLSSLRRTIESYMPAGKPKRKTAVRGRRKPARRAKAKR